MSPTPDRRRFTAAYKRRVLAAADQCTAPGAIAALLRREGLYSSNLAAWRAARARGELTGPAPRRGPKPTPPDPSAKRIVELERALRKATARAERAEALVAVQKNSPARRGAPSVAPETPGPIRSADREARPSAFW